MKVRVCLWLATWKNTTIFRWKNGGAQAIDTGDTSGMALWNPQDGKKLESNENYISRAKTKFHCCNHPIRASVISAGNWLSG